MEAIKLVFRTMQDARLKRPSRAPRFDYLS
jgi:hypothetical protein